MVYRQINQGIGIDNYHKLPWQNSEKNSKCPYCFKLVPESETDNGEKCGKSFCEEYFGKKYHSQFSLNNWILLRSSKLTSSMFLIKFQE